MGEERVEGIWQEGAGTVREAWGRATDQPDVETRGQIEQMVGQAKQFAGSVGRGVSRAVEQVRQDPSMQSREARMAALKLLAYIAGALVLINGIVSGARRRG